MKNLAILTDSYKVSHWKQYPPKTEYVYSYLESRGGEFDSTVFFGLQYIIKKYLLNPVTMADIVEAEQLWAEHFNNENIFNVEGWKYIVEKHGGYLPLRIRAVKEGSVVNTNNVLMTIENTDPNVPWLTNWMETILMQIWYPSTVATQSFYMKKIILEYLEETGDTSLINFKLHDFGFRGSTSVESSGIGGLAHLVNFSGTDTASALVMAREYYNCEMAGFSIPAAEHSTITSWGKDKELEAYKNMLEQYPEGLIAVVSDSYNIYNACEHIWGEILHDDVLKRNGTLVIRPDSGEPSTVILNILRILEDKFGSTKNDKGFRVLNPKIGIIQGDGIDKNSISEILFNMKTAKWSADNIAFGSGGALLQKVNRDTSKFAIKCSAICINSKWFDVFKDPITDHGKKSKKGRFSLIHDHNMKYHTIPYIPGEEDLEVIFRNGVLVREQNLTEIKSLIAKSL